MIDARIFGSRLCALRKEKGFTQAETADALRISYQAVSSWERGETMPDIVKLPEIAQLFGTSLDSLFREDHIEEAGEPTRQEIVAPAARPVTAQYEGEAEEEDAVRLKNAMKVLHFIDRDTADEIALDLLDRNIDIPYAKLMPFVGRNVAQRLMQRAMERGVEQREFERMLPFLSREDCDRAANHLLETGAALEPGRWLHFISKEYGEAVIDRALASGIRVGLEVMPFVSRALANRLAREHLLKKDE